MAQGVGRGVVGPAAAHGVELVAQFLAVVLQRLIHIAQLGIEYVGAVREFGHYRLLGGRVHELALHGVNFFQLLTVHKWRERIAHLLVRQPGHGNQKRQNHDPVLHRLGPGYRAHAAQKRAHQHAPQP